MHILYITNRSTLAMLTLDDPSATMLNQLWQLFLDGISLSSEDASPGCRVVEYSPSQHFPHFLNTNGNIQAMH